MNLRPDFPMLLLADVSQIPYLSGYGMSAERRIHEVEVVYPKDVHRDEPWLRLNTVVRQGWGINDDHEPVRKDLSLRALGWKGASSILYAPGVVPGELRDTAERAQNASHDLGSQIPGPPWELRSFELDGATHAVWVLTLENDFFALVADCGPVRLTGDGRHLDAWTFALQTVPAAQAQDRIHLGEDINDEAAGRAGGAGS